MTNRMIDDTFAPIATAPRDGTLIIVGHEKVGTFPMRFVADQTNEVFAPGMVGMWLVSDGTMTWMDDAELGPSHWKPLDRRALN